MTGIQRHTLISVGCLVLFVVAIGGCLVSARRAVYRHNHKFDNFTFADIEKKTHVRFPQSAGITNREAVAGLGNLVDLRARIIMDRKDVDGFIKGIPDEYGRKVEVSRTDKAGMDMRYAGNRIPKWWRTDEVRNFIALIPPRSYTHILIDLDHPDKAVVYLHWAH